MRGAGLLSKNERNRRDAAEVAVPVVDTGEIERLQVLLAEATQTLAATDAEVRRLRNTDGLTGLWNRQYIEDVLSVELFRGDSPPPSSLLVVSVDRMGDLIAEHGLRHAEEVLVAVAERLGSTLRAKDVLGRRGGEEFLVLLAGADVVGATIAAERLRALLKAAPLAGESGVTVSMGAAQRQGGDDLAGWLARADEALGRAQADGHDAVRVAPRSL